MADHFRGQEQAEANQICELTVAIGKEGAADDLTVWTIANSMLLSANAILERQLGAAHPAEPGNARGAAPRPVTAQVSAFIVDALALANRCLRRAVCGWALTGGACYTSVQWVDRLELVEDFGTRSQPG